MLGLPDGTRACLFDLDGVLTQTAKVHAAAWKQMFDEYLRERGDPEFTQHDYDEYVDGKPREELIRRDGVDTYDGSIRYVEAVRDAGLRRAVVSSSANTHEVLRVTGIADLFEAVVDGVTAQREHIPGKPAPDMFLAGARAVDVQPHEAAVFEDALAGVQAGHAGKFGCVVGVDRVGQADELRAHGADLVVQDLAELLKR
jgi:HAD superfamily hydrolase (TIGR01509 family)